MALSRDEIFSQVQEVMIDALGVDDDEVTAEATLMGDLGAESIDFLDVVFRLEKAFDIKIAREELFPADALMNDPDLVGDDQKLTDKGMALLKEKMPQVMALAGEVTTGELVITESVLRDDLLSALVNLGYQRGLADRAVDQVLRDDPDLAFEQALKKTLRVLSG